MALKDLFEAARRRLEKPHPAIELERTGTHRENVRLSNPWHSVCIQPGVKRCEAVNALVGQRFLSKDAPKLPLSGCTEPACTCRYRHFDDRRLEGAALDRNGMPLPHPHRRSGD